MSKNRSEKSHFDMANHIYRQMKDQQMELYRLFRVYHPVYEISVNIETKQIEDNYHIIEKYMDKLVCGYTGENKNENVSEGIFVKSKDELFELLGIDKEAYEIADKFYWDLITAGHFEEVPGMGIRGLEAARDSIKLEKKVNSATVKQRKLFDQFSGKLMPGEFYELKKYACKRGMLNQDSSLQKNSVWLKPNSTILNSNADIEQMLGNFNYVNNEQIDLGLPQGYQSMRIALNEPIEMLFYPYYLGVFLDETGKLEYRAFRIDNGSLIKWIGEQYKQYKTDYYKTAVTLFESLTQISEENVENPLNRKFFIKQNGNPDLNNGISMIQSTGNYKWQLQDWQVTDLIGEGDDKTFKRSSCWMIANNDIICLTSYEAGRIIKILKTDSQRQRLLERLTMNGDKERDHLNQTDLNKEHNYQSGSKTEENLGLNTELGETNVEKTQIEEKGMKFFNMNNNKRIIISEKASDVKKYSKCPFCWENYNGNYYSRCPNCGESFDDIKRVEFVCSENNQDDIEKTINEWLENHRIKLNLAPEVKPEKSTYGVQFIKSVVFSYKEEKSSNIDKYRFAIICANKGKDNKDSYIDEWTSSHKTGANFIRTIYDNEKQLVTVLIVYKMPSTSLVISAPKNNPELTKCPFCENYIYPKKTSCPKCDKSFYDVYYVDFTQDEIDNTMILEEVNRFISDRNKDIFDMPEIKTSTGPVKTSNGNIRRESFIDSIRVYYIPLSEEREYDCTFDQIARLETKDKANELEREWGASHPKPSKAVMYGYNIENEEKCDAFGLSYSYPESEDEASLSSDTQLDKSSSEDNLKRTLTEEDKKRINEAKKLYAEKKYTEALETFEEFAYEDSNCSFLLGFMYQNALGVEQDYEKAFYWYDVSSKHGNIYSQANLGACYEMGWGTEENLEKAFSLYLKSAEQGYANAMFLSGLCYDKGKGVNKSEEKALLWYKKAIKAGYKEPYYRAAIILLNGSNAVKDEKEAEKYFLLSIENDIKEAPAAANCLGMMYRDGRGVEKDMRKAVEYFELGSKNGNAEAKYHLGCLYITGDYLPHDREKALQLFEEAEKSNCAPARLMAEKMRIENAKLNNKSAGAETSEINQAKEKQHSMLNMFAEEIKRDNILNVEIDVGRNLAVWTKSTKMLRSVKIDIQFEPEKESIVQYAFITMHNVVDFSEDKKDSIYRICSDASRICRGVSFYVEESDNSVTASMRACFTKEQCSKMCSEDIALLTDYVDKVYPMFMKAIWS